MFESCYEHNFCTVGVAGPSAEVMSSLQSYGNCSITVIDNEWKSEENPASRYKLQHFLVSISSVTYIKRILQHLKTSHWWNHMASFLIIDNPPPLDKSCYKAFEILYTAWQLDILHAKFICNHKVMGTLIYSYNPYSDEVPYPWQVDKNYGKKKKHSWNLLVRIYQDTEKDCENLDFDKTNDLGGYEIQASVRSALIKNSPGTDVENVDGPNANIVRHIFRALKSTSKVFAVPQDKLYSMTATDLADISLDPCYQQNVYDNLMTYPHRSSTLASISQHRGNLSQIGKLLRVIDDSSRYAFVIVCLVAFVFFKFFLRQTVTTAILTIVRLVSNASIPNIPENLAVRIFLSALFTFLVTLQAIYHGQLASMSTISMALPDVETFEDLQNFKYTVYGHKEFKIFFKNLNLSEIYVPLENFGCDNYVLRDNTAACVDEKLQLVDVASKYDLHLSDALMQGFVGFVIRENFPLEERLNTVISRLVEGNIIEHVVTKDIVLPLRKQKIDQNERRNHSFTVLTLKDLAFAFAILGIGFTIATVVFIVEVWTGRR